MQGEQESLDHLAQLGPSGTMALLENLDQRETLDHVVSHWAWNATSASGTAATRICE